MSVHFLIPERYRESVQEFTMVPPDLRQFEIASDEIRYTQFSMGAVLEQAIIGNSYSFKSNVFQISEAVELYPVSNESLLTLHYLLDGDDIRCEVPNYGEITLTAGRYHLFYVPKGVVNTSYFSPGIFISYQVDIAPSFLDLMTQAFTPIREMIASQKKNVDTAAVFHPGVIDYRIKTLLTDIALCTKIEPSRSLIINAKIYELLSIYTHELKEAQNSPIGDAFLKKILDIKAFLNMHLDEYITLPMLSSKFNISGTTLRRQFSAHFKITVFSYLLQQRMEAAKIKLLQTNEPIGAVATKVGYSDLASFTHAFKRYFGITPSDIRKSMAIIHFAVLWSF